MMASPDRYDTRVRIPNQSARRVFLVGAAHTRHRHRESIDFGNSWILRSAALSKPLGQVKLELSVDAQSEQDDVRDHGPDSLVESVDEKWQGVGTKRIADE